MMFLFLTEPPSPPGLPEITDWDEKSVKLKWDKPINGTYNLFVIVEFIYQFCVSLIYLEIIYWFNFE